MTLPGGGYLAAGGLLCAVLAGLGGHAHGLDTGRMRERAAIQKDADKAHAARDRLRGQIEQAALMHLQADQQRQATNREIIRESQTIVERPVYRNRCVDADGVHILDRAAANANGERASSPAGEAGKAAQGAAGN